MGRDFSKMSGQPCAVPVIMYNQHTCLLHFLACRPAQLAFGLCEVCCSQRIVVCIILQAISDHAGVAKAAAAAALAGEAALYSKVTNAQVSALL